jgi:hypothetical protein
VEQRQWDDDGIAMVAAEDESRGERRDRHREMRGKDALGQRGCPRRVQALDGVAVLDEHLQRRVVAREQVVEADEAVLDRRQRLGHRSELRLDDERARSRLLEAPTHLLGLQAEVDRLRDQPGLRAGEVRHHELPRVPAQHADLLLTLETQAEQRPPDGVRAALELSIRERDVAVDDRGAVAEAGRASRQEIAGADARG